MNPEFGDIFELKNELWNLRYFECLKSKTPPWSSDELLRVTKKLKTNKTRDPMGLINEIFKPGIIGQDLFSALKALINETKAELLIPIFMRLANITSIYKSKWSKFSLESDRRIFVLTVVRMIMDRLLHNDLYPEIEEKMSYSNIGAQKNKNVQTICSSSTKLLTLY